MSAYDNMYAILEQGPHPSQGEPLYHLLVQLLLLPSYESARQLYWTLVETALSPYTPLSPTQTELMDSLFVLLQVLQENRNLDTGNPLWLIPLRLAQMVAQPEPPVSNKKYVVRRLAQNPFRFGVFETDKPLYTEQVFPSREMAEYALYRNQPFAGVYDGYFHNTHYGAGGLLYHRRIVSVPEKTRAPKPNIC